MGRQSQWGEVTSQYRWCQQGQRREMLTLYTGMRGKSYRSVVSIVEYRIAPQVKSVRATFVLQTIVTPSELLFIDWLPKA